MEATCTVESPLYTHQDSSDRKNYRETLLEGTGVLPLDTPPPRLDCQISGAEEHLIH